MNGFQKPGRSVLLLLSGCILLWVWYGSWDLQGPDEGRYVQVAKELLGRSNWFVLTVHGTPYTEKPPLPFWMLAAMLKLNGGEVTAWAVRFPSVLSGILIVLLVYDIGRRRLGERVGLVAGFVMLTAPLFAAQTTTARLDVLFTGWIVGAFWVLLTAPGEQRLSWSRVILFWICVGGAFFTKGPLAILITLGTLLIEASIERSWKPWRQVRPLLGVSVLSALIGGWLWIEYELYGSAFLKAQMATGTVNRLLQGSHHRPIWYYVYCLFSSAFMPWTLFLVFAVVDLWKKRKEEKIFHAMLPIVIWAFYVFILLHLGAGKRRHYLLPTLPAMALIVGWFIDARLLGHAVSSRFMKTFGVVMLLVWGGCLGASTLALIDPESFWDLEFYILAWHAAVLILVALIVLGLGARLIVQRRWDSIVAFLVLALLAGEGACSAIVNQVLDYRKSTRLFALCAESLASNNERVIGALGKAAKAEYHVYGDYHVLPLEATPGTFLKNATLLPSLIVARSEDLKECEKAAKQAGFAVSYKLRASGDDLVFFQQPKARSSAHPLAGDEPLTFVFTGDTGIRTSYVVEQVLAVHRRHPLSGIFLLGDNLYGNKPFPVAVERRFIRPFKSLIEERIPFYATLGNHDDNDHVPDRLPGEINFPLFNMRGREYYLVSFGENIVTFFIINSQSIEQDPEQIAWLKQAVQDCSSRWKVLVLHTPMQASAIHHGANTSLYSLLKDIVTGKDGIDVALAGHNHVYERREVLEGVLHITVGCRGELFESGVFPPDNNRVTGYHEKRCFAWAQISNKELRFQAVNQDGQVVDRFRLTKDHEVFPLEFP